MIILLVCFAILLIWLIVGTIRVSNRSNDGFWDGFMTFMMLDLLFEIIGAILSEL